MHKVVSVSIDIVVSSWNIDLDGFKCYVQSQKVTLLWFFFVHLSLTQSLSNTGLEDLKSFSMDNVMLMGSTFGEKTCEVDWPLNLHWTNQGCDALHPQYAFLVNSNPNNCRQNTGNTLTNFTKWELLATSQTHWAPWCYRWGGWGGA